MSAHGHAGEIETTVLRRMLVAFIAQELRTNGVAGAKRVFHGFVGGGKGQIARTSQVESAIAALIHEATDILIQDDDDCGVPNAVLGRGAHLLGSSSSQGRR